ncbi:hypothetical protein SAMN05216327_102169 [Dyadobacter sp. SG02]|nr:hypothetical protein SAMN05216327_102169 [Dyadobacter sp. SG02]
MNQRAATITCLLFVTVLVIQCNFRNEVSHYPSDFRFKIEAWEFSYTSRNQTYVRNFVNGDTTIFLPLDKMELQLI